MTVFATKKWPNESNKYMTNANIQWGYGEQAC